MKNKRDFPYYIPVEEIWQKNDNKYRAILEMSTLEEKLFDIAKELDEKLAVKIIKHYLGLEEDREPSEVEPKEIIKPHELEELKELKEIEEEKGEVFVTDEKEEFNGE